MFKKSILFSGTLIFVGLIAIVISGCGQQTNNTNSTTSSGIILSVKADFSRSGVKTSNLKIWHTSSAYPEVFLTPDHYLIALKSVKLVGQNTSEVFEFFNHTSLESCTIVDFSSNEVKEIALSTKEVTLGNWQNLEVEVYWVQEQIPLKAGTPSRPASLEAPVIKNIRIYLTDDQAVETWRNLAANNEHHQGDLTIIDSDERTELGWHYPPSDFSASTKGRPGRDETGGYASNQNDDQGDPVTKHDRGPFGDNLLWGARISGEVITGTNPENIFVTRLPIQGISLNTTSRIIVRLDVKDTWVFSDVDGDGYFSPGYLASDDANDLTKGWAPLLPNISFESF